MIFDRWTQINVKPIDRPVASRREESLAPRRHNQDVFEAKAVLYQHINTIYLQFSLSIVDHVFWNTGSCYRMINQSDICDGLVR